MTYDLFTQPSDPKVGTQTDRILTWLRMGHSLTPLEALDRFQCMRLAAVVFSLKKLGWQIRTIMINNDATGKRYARYTMRKTGV